MILVYDYEKYSWQWFHMITKKNLIPIEYLIHSRGIYTTKMLLDAYMQFATLLLFNSVGISKRMKREAATVVHFCITPQHSRHFPTYLKEHFLMKKWSLIYRKNKRMKHTIFLLSSWVNIINKYFITIHLCFVDVNSTEIFLVSLRLMQQNIKLRKSSYRLAWYANKFYDL